jgi:bifunctional DNA-binding transcriptional regulator/antitoxin component of YhaV-PrlF toxin-antitoxin module
MIPAELLAKYGLREGDALEAVEVGIARALTRALKKNVSVSINGKLEITAFSDRGEPVKISPGQIDRNLRRHILHLVELELQKRQTLRESEDLEELRGTTAPGEITRIADDGALHVTLEIIDGFHHLTLNGECPVDHQPLHERDRYRIGRIYSSSPSAMTSARSRPTTTGCTPRATTLSFR